jgi:hypothetical protein
MAAQINRSVYPLRINCREIGEDDFERLADLLANGFHQSREHWMRCLQRLREHTSPPGFPKYGYVLACNGDPVGVVLLIFLSVRVDGEIRIRCHVCSWYVEPDFRSYASMFAAYSLRWKDVTYINVAPAPHTLPILEAQGYVKYSRGWFAALPALCARSGGVSVRPAEPDNYPENDSERQIVKDHTAYGCISLVCRAPTGNSPFIFMRRSFGRIPFAYLVYCRSIAEFVRCAGPLGRFLAWRGIPLVCLDANGPIPGLIGKYVDNHPKYFKGPDQPRAGDLTYSELVMFRFVGDRVARAGRRKPHRSRGNSQRSRVLVSDQGAFG